MALQSDESREASRIARLNAMRGGGNGVSINRRQVRYQQPALPPGWSSLVREPIVPQGTSQGTILTDPNIATGSRAVALTDEQIRQNRENANFHWDNMTRGINHQMNQDPHHRNIHEVIRQLNGLKRLWLQEYLERGNFNLDRGQHYRDQIRILHESLIP
jgi:hypothetical protein